jgi:hypothetical protein
MLQKGPTFNHVLVKNVARLPKKFEFKIRKRKILCQQRAHAVGKEQSSPRALQGCWERRLFANSMVALLAKGCSLCQQLTAKLLAKRTASAPFSRAGASPTAVLSQQECCWERTPSPTAALCHQSLDFGLLAKISFPTAEFSCWERVSSPTA